MGWLVRASMLLGGVLSAQVATLTIAPPVITECRGGVGHAVLSWRAPEPVEVRVGGASGPPFTGIEPAEGSAATGDWVGDGMKFALVSASGVPYAEAVARVDCGSALPLLGQGLERLGYLPLQVGNRWVYRNNSRVATSTYTTQTIVRSEERGGETWYVAAVGDSEIMYRTDAEGRIFRWAGGEELLLDPHPAPRPEALLKVESRRGPTATAFGWFPAAVDYNRMQPLLFERGTYVAGLGLVSSTSNIVAGSSGGFSNSAELVEARIGGRLWFRQPAPALELAVESTVLEVTAKRVANCAVPCYFVACGIAGGSDPPGTYKPCFRVRVGLERQPAGVLELALVDDRERVATRVSVPAPARPDDVIQYQLPLYAQPNQPFPAGAYRLTARLLAEGTETASASIAVRIE
ncbi:MAG: hypothetical protein Q8N47_22540 [Bryobacterales bacterium]|nr:hypothetical protein [Bryobacterales bacterium]